MGTGAPLKESGGEQRDRKEGRKVMGSAQMEKERENERLRLKG